MLGSDTGCLLDKNTPYHAVAEQFGAVGLCIPEGAGREEIERTLKLAQVCGSNTVILVGTLVTVNSFML